MTPPRDLEAPWSNPPAEYRSAPFWSWNARLEPERLCRAIDTMHAAGMGGFFMHSRYGLKTPYLSEEWFDCVSACVKRARQLGMKAYLYDEDRWPSGPAGGIVTRDHPEYAEQALTVGPPDESSGRAEPLARFAVVLDHQRRLVRHRRLGEGEHAKPEEEEEIFSIVSGWPRDHHNEAPYLDALNPDAVAAFLESTHESYARRFGGAFGSTVPAIFTDEPNCGRLGARANTLASWTSRLPEIFRDECGYDLLDHLPELSHELADEAFSAVRYDYRRIVTELFAGSFSRQIGQWCGRHGIAMTGHYLAEETLASQTDRIGSAMAHYEHMQWPGIDILRDQCDELATAKQCASVADQLGRERVLSELYGCTGWDWPLEGHKYVGDWHYAVGVNLRCPHLTHYSLAGGAKRDFPASIFSHSPWWPCYSIVEDYFARLGVALTRGRPVRDVLVLNTIESSWGGYVPAAPDAVDSLDTARREIIYALSEQHYDWDFGDEGLLVHHGRVEGDRLWVGRMNYGLVVVPPCLTLRRSTVDLLAELLRGGGHVLFAGRTPTRIDGRPDAAASELVGQTTACGASGEDVLAAIGDRIARRVSVSEDGRELSCTWAMLREVEDGRLLFVQSHDREEPHRARVCVEGRRPAVFWDPKTGERRMLPADEADGRVTFELSLPPTGSALVSLGWEVPDAAPSEPSRTEAVTDRLEGPFDIGLAEPNTMPLDYCRYRVSDGDLSEPVPVLAADAAIRAHFGLSPRSNGGPQPWYLYSKGRIDTAPRGRCELRWEVQVGTVPSGCKLAVESARDYAITVNGRTPPVPDGWWVDEDIETIDIGHLLIEGSNEIALSFEYRADMELENLYLVGDFGVARRDAARCWEPANVTLVAAPKQLALGSWVERGLPFYGGAVRYRINVTRPVGGRVRIRLPEVRCTAAVVHAGGREFVLPWPPFEADVTDALRDGDNKVLIEVVGGRKNILGPLHAPWASWTGPEQFNPNNPAWTHEYQLTDHGLFEPPLVVTTQQT